MAITNKAIIELYKAANGLSLDTPLYTWAAWYNMDTEFARAKSASIV